MRTEPPAAALAVDAAAATSVDAAAAAVVAVAAATAVDFVLQELVVRRSSSASRASSSAARRFKSMARRSRSAGRGVDWTALKAAMRTMRGVEKCILNGFC